MSIYQKLEKTRQRKPKVHLIFSEENHLRKVHVLDQIRQLFRDKKPYEEFIYLTKQTPTSPEPDEFNFNNDTAARVFENIDYGDGCLYEGDISEKQRHGTGSLTYSNGDMYLGTFVKNTRYGNDFDNNLHYRSW